MTEKKSICILSLSPIADDPRVRRQAQAFHDAGWNVTAIGVGESRSPAPNWRIIQADAKPDMAAVQMEAEPAPVSAPAGGTMAAASVPGTSEEGETAREQIKREIRHLIPPQYRARLRPFVHLGFRVLNITRRLASMVRQRIYALPSAAGSLRGIFGRSESASKDAGLSAAELAAMPLPPPMDADKAERNYLAVFEIDRMYRAAKNIQADFYLANDWHMLPVARKLALRHGTQFGYDTHEYAVEEYRYKPEFLETRVPMVRAIEERGLREAAVTTAVSAGIAEDMAKLHGIARVPVEIRNVPNRINDLPPLVPTRSRMRVYFHGIITFDRGLEECIKSVPLWRDEFVFQMRGPIRPEFLPVLKSAIVEAGVWDRVEILPEVAMVDLVHAAAGADIGISTPPSTSKHNIYALPNKFFEYIQAGLAMCVADLPDMQRIMKKYDLGVAIRSVTPEAIAEAVNSFTPELVDRYKANSRRAAAELNWEVEQKRLVDLYEEALAARRAAQA